MWCRGTGDLFKLRSFLTPDGSRLSCGVRAKSPYDPTFFAPRRIEELRYKKKVKRQASAETAGS